MISEPSKPIQSSPSVALAIKELRFRLGETQLQFAVRTGLALSSLTRYETGAQQPKASILKALSAVAKEHKFTDLVRTLNAGLANRVHLRSSLRPQKKEGVMARVGAAGRLIDKSCEQIDEALRLQSTREDEPGSDYREQLQRLLFELSEQRCMLAKLIDAVERRTRESSMAADAASPDSSSRDLNLIAR